MEDYPVSNFKKRIVPEHHAPAVLSYLDSEHGQPWKAVGTRTIAAALGITRHRVMDTLDFLEQEGVIRKEERAAPTGAFGVNWYYVNREHPKFRIYLQRERET